jgi:hypothetical protein
VPDRCIALLGATIAKPPTSPKTRNHRPNGRPVDFRAGNGCDGGIAQHDGVSSVDGFKL